MTEYKTEPQPNPEK